MSQLRVLVVGASIAGPMTAYWLAKAGIRVTVIERFPELRMAGQNIDIRTTGVTVMNKIPGLEALVRSKRPPLEGFSIRNAEDKPYLTIKQSGDPKAQSLLSEYEVYRGDLSKAIYDETIKTGLVDYIFGEQLSAIEQADNLDGPVTVEFQSGRPAQSFDLVVAGDGATSRTRQLGFGGGQRDGIVPIPGWAAYFSTPKDFVNGSKIGMAHAAVRGRFAAVGGDNDGRNRVSFLCNYAGEKGDTTAPFREAVRGGDESLKNFITNHYAGIGWKVPEFLAAMRESTDLYASEYMQVKLPQLSKGRFVVVGDAAYAPGLTGTGTSLAMTGAYVLAGSIATHKDNINAGLAAYAETMKPIIKEMQKMPSGVFAFMAPWTAWGLQVRNSIFTVIDKSGLVNLAQRLSLGSASANADKWKLLDYGFSTTAA